MTTSLRSSSGKFGSVVLALAMVAAGGAGGSVPTTADLYVGKTLVFTAADSTGIHRDQQDPTVEITR